MTPAAALELARTGLTVYVADFGRGPELTTRIPCGRTLAYSLGRWPPDALPTLSEMKADLASARAQIARDRRRTA